MKVKTTWPQVINCCPSRHALYGGAIPHLILNLSLPLSVKLWNCGFYDFVVSNSELAVLQMFGKRPHLSLNLALQGIIEYVFAAVNFDLFKSIMVRHNAALSLQALQMIKGGCADSQELEAEVMKFSETEYQSQREEFDSRSVKEMADLEAALKKSRLDCETLLKDIERENTEVIEGPGGSGLPPPPDQIYPEIPEDLLVFPKPSAPAAPEPTPVPAQQLTPVPKAREPSPDIPDQPAQPIPEIKEPVQNKSSLPPLKVARPPKASEDGNAAQKWMEDAKADEGDASPSEVVPTPQTIEERRVYWQQRKQEIVDTKRAVGLETLKTHEPNQAVRPKSARVAVARVTSSATVPPEVVVEQLNKGSRQPAMSSALAAALRREVINK
eukprot:sb/3465618/